MTEHSDRYELFGKVLKILKFTEIILLGIVVMGVSYLIYLNACETSFCIDSRPTPKTFSLILAVFFPFFGATSALRLALDYIYNDQDPDPENMYYVSLIGVFLVYSIFGIYSSEFTSVTARDTVSTFSFTASLAILVFTTLSFFSVSSIWERCSRLVRFRLAITFINLILLIMNPGIGLLVSLLLIPIMILLPDKEK